MRRPWASWQLDKLLVPEGDTIFRAARTLHRALAGKLVVRFESVFPHLTRVHEDTPITGRTVEEVRAAGKHLLMQFSGDLVLRTHMRMNGSWHIYRPGEAWQRSRRSMRVLVGTADYEAIAFDIQVAEWLRGKEIERQEDLRRLGPDLLGAAFDAAEAARRIRARGDSEIADVLLNQRVVAGIGNVYKSEVLFACGVNPFAPVASVSDEQIDCLLTTARRFFQANVIEALAPMTTYTGFRRTTGRVNLKERLWVYGRANEPCRKCATAVSIRPQGRDARLTYWCSTCQPSTS